MSGKLEKLTEEQGKLIPVIRDEWINFCLGGNSEINRDIATEGIRWIYGLAQKKPPFTIFVDGPMQCQVAVNFLKFILKNKNMAQVRDQKIEYADFSANDLGWDSDWMAFYHFFKQIGVVNFDKYDKYLEYLRSGVFMSIMLGDFTIACPRPSVVKRDDNNRLHSEDSAAVEWKNEKYYFYHGVGVLGRHIYFPQSITIDEIEKEGNLEKQRTLIEIKGVDNYIKEQNCEIIDRDNLKLDGSSDRLLVKTKNGMKWLIGSDGSTGRVYHMAVENNVNSCRVAHERMCGFSEDRIIAEA